MTTLHRLFDEQGQSPWLDNLKRGYFKDGTLQRLVDQGIRGVTSNPTIFQKAIAASDDYDEQFAEATRRLGVEDAYWELVIDDIRHACDVLRPVFDQSRGADGHVSIEVAPALARDTDGTRREARSMWARVDRPNLMIKIPGTVEGLPAVRSSIAEGISVNVTLIFGVPRYGEVVEAYVAGVEDHLAAGGDLSGVRSVASFFVSRVDVEVDRRLRTIGTDGASALLGTAAVNQAKLAYELFQQRFATSRWGALQEHGAHAQRPLWASTSTKDPSYPDLLYVDSLIGPGTVNTMPDATIAGFLDHGTVARTVDRDLDQARAGWAALAEVGIDVDDVARTLVEEGVASFSKSYDELLAALTDKANELS
ncbi:MAG: transaldolase [Acidimicrobiales bacterium]